MVKPAVFGLVALLPLVSSSPGVHKLKLNKTSHGHSSPQPLEAYVLNKYSDALAPPQVPLMGTDGASCRVNVAADGPGHTVPLTNFNAQYFTEIQLGTPPQSFKVKLLHHITSRPILTDKYYQVILDTASSNLCIPSIKCTSISCFLHSRYDSSKSTTYRANGTEYGKGPMEGFVSQDLLTIGDLAVPKQDFAEVTKEPFESSKFDGILGLGYDTISVNGIVPPFYNMINAGLLDEPVFSFRVGSSEEDGGEVTLGGIDHEGYVGKIFYVPVRRKASWEVELEKVSFGGDELELKNTGAVIDTGTSLIVFPSDIADMLNAQIGATRSWNGQYTVDCTTVPSLPRLSFYLGGKPYSLEGSDYILNIKGTCVSSFTGFDLTMPDGGAIWILGDVFLRKYFTVYDLAWVAAFTKESILRQRPAVVEAEREKMAATPDQDDDNTGVQSVSNLPLGARAPSPSAQTVPDPVLQELRHLREEMRLLAAAAAPPNYK
ncbi:Endopeptidase [Mycena venus]|uniref:Endopeptidase n=1 Tax=Mycena venus TaxID=2733690 RepID=A0A8H6YYQ1_9AGAR|nr:Endopeptidase [Mycena venus]